MKQRLEIGGITFDTKEAAKRHTSQLLRSRGGRMTVTSIAWTDVTWNCIRGCSRVSEGCRNCYAEKIAARFSDQWALPPLPPSPGGDMEDEPRLFARMTTSGARWTGRVELVPEKLEEPLRWREPRRVFVNSMSDLFHESLPDEAIDRVFAVMAMASRHTFQILTKRPERMLRYLSDRQKHLRWTEVSRTLRAKWTPASGGWSEDWWGRFSRHIWIGVSCEDQKTADGRIPLLMQTPAAVRFVSLEPLLEPIHLNEMATRMYLHWVIVGGESGPGARPCDVAWIRDIVRQCKTAGVPAFVKQIGARSTGEPWASNRRFSPLVRDRKGGDPSEWPEDIRVREFPRGHP